MELLIVFQFSVSLSEEIINISKYSPLDFYGGCARPQLLGEGTQLPPESMPMLSLTAISNWWTRRIVGPWNTSPKTRE